MNRKVRIKNKEVEEILSGSSPVFPKYSTQILNLANQDAQGTRPSIVGQMSDLIQEFDGKTLREWEEWYKDKNPNSILQATDRVSQMLENFKEVISKIDRNLIERWITDLVIVKTFAGLKFQEAILKKVAEISNSTYSLSNSEQEAKGIDGYIGTEPVSIKPISYKNERALPENIECKMIFYEKKKDGIDIEFDL